MKSSKEWSHPLKSVRGNFMVESILVYTGGEVIGDGLVKLPFFMALKQIFPESKLTLLTGGDTVYKNILKDLSEDSIDEILPEPLETRRRFDLIIDTQYNVIKSWKLRTIPHGRFLSGPKGHWKKSSTRGRVIDELMKLASRATGYVVKPPVIMPNEIYRQRAMSLLHPDKSYIGFAPGAGHVSKKWPLESFINLAAEQDRSGYSLVFFLGPMEQGDAPIIARALSDALIVKNATPEMTIALAQNLTASVANDSGGGHLLAAGQKPLVSLIRSDSVRKKFLPSTPKIIGLTPEDFGVETMQMIPLQAVSKALRDLLS